MKYQHTNKKQHPYLFTFIFLIFGFWFLVLPINQTQAGCIVGRQCPAGQTEVSGPCPYLPVHLTQVNCEITSQVTTPAPSSSVSLPNPLGTNDIRVVIGRIIQILMSAIGSIALMILIYGGFQWLTAMGNPEKIKKGKDIMLWTLLGVIIMFSSYFIVRFVINTLTLGTEVVPPITSTGAPF